MTRSERARRTERRNCRLLCIGCVSVLLAAVWLPVVALVAGYAVLAFVAWVAASAFRV